jgi:hypothetical protein
MTPPASPARLALRLCCILPLATLGACVERTITVTSEPPGAIVWLNDVEIGRTPVETDFTFYGVYDVRLRLEGYEPVISSRNANAPVYDLPGLDLVSEAIPAKIESEIAWHFVLTPLPEREPGADRDALQQALIERARSTREQVTPASEAPPPDAPAAPASTGSN